MKYLRIAAMLAGMLTAACANAATLSPADYGSTRNWGAGQAFPASPIQLFNYWSYFDRGNIEFDISGIVGPVALAELVLPVFTTSNAEGALVNLRSYAGNGTIDYSDFSAGTNFTSFNATAAVTEMTFDVTSIVNSLIGASQSYLGITGYFEHEGNTSVLPWYAIVQFGGQSSGPQPQLRIESGSTSAVPLPAGLPLLAAGLGVMGLLGRSRRRGTAA